MERGVVGLGERGKASGPERATHAQYGIVRRSLDNGSIPR